MSDYDNDTNVGNDCQAAPHMHNMYPSPNMLGDAAWNFDHEMEEANEMRADAIKYLGDCVQNASDNEWAARQAIAEAEAASKQAMAEAGPNADVRMQELKLEEVQALREEQHATNRMQFEIAKLEREHTLAQDQLVVSSETERRTQKWRTLRTYVRWLGMVAILLGPLYFDPNFWGNTTGAVIKACTQYLNP